MTSVQVVRRWVRPVFGVFCSTTGEMVEADHEGEPEAQILHDCGQWTWENANYCVHCGKPLRGA